MSKWMINEWVNEWMNERMNKCIKMNDYWPGTDQQEGRVGRDHLVPASWTSPPLHCTGTYRIVFTLISTVF